MALGINLVSSAAPRMDDPLSAIAAFVEGQLPEAGSSRGRSAAGRSTLFVNVHPAAEDLTISVLESGELVFSARTTSAGRGYHAFVVDEFLDPLAAALGVRWKAPSDDGGDDTRYSRIGTVPPSRTRCSGGCRPSPCTSWGRGSLSRTFSSGWISTKTVAELRAKQRPGALETFELDEGDRVGLAELGKGTNEGREFWKLSGRTHVRGGLAITTVCFDRSEDFDWALGVWRSLRHGNAR